MPPHQPHDKLFKAGFGDPANAAGFLRSQLPESVVDAIDWTGLELVPGSFIDSQLRHSESDLLFSAEAFGREVGLYLLFEHQTTEDRRIALRLLRYMVRIWEEHAKRTGDGALPVIVPVVLAQNERKWQLRENFAGLFELPPGANDAFGSFVPDFVFRLVQLAEIPFEAIAGTPSGIMVLRTLKAERSGQLLDDPVWDEALLRQMPRTLFEMLLSYLLNSDLDAESIDDKLKKVQEPKIRTAAMTFAEKHRQEGRQEGRQEAILSNLEIRLGEVPAGLVDAVREVADSERLAELQKASLDCSTFEEFAAVL